MDLSIKGYTRDKLGKESAADLRDQGYLPAVVYGKNLESNLHIYLSYHDFEKLLHKVGRNKLFKLDLGDNVLTVFVKDLQIHPVKRTISHVDLQSVSGDEEVSVVVPVEFIGVAKGSKLGGAFRRAVWNLKIKVKANQIPESIKLDISDLDIGDTLVVYKIRDKVPYRILNHDNTLIAGVYKGS
ncbi:MAG: 50S ribosomal protein L25 [Brevinematia bacterium]